METRTKYYNIYTQTDLTDIKSIAIRELVKNIIDNDRISWNETLDSNIRKNANLLKINYVNNLHNFKTNTKEERLDLLTAFKVLD